MLLFPPFQEPRARKTVARRNRHAMRRILNCQEVGKNRGTGAAELARHYPAPQRLQYPGRRLPCRDRIYPNQLLVLRAENDVRKSTHEKIAKPCASVLRTGLWVLADPPDGIFNSHMELSTKTCPALLIPCDSLFQLGLCQIVEDRWHHGYFFRSPAKTFSAGSPTTVPLSISCHLRSNSASQAT